KHRIYIGILDEVPASACGQIPVEMLQRQSLITKLVPNSDAHDLCGTEMRTGKILPETAVRTCLYVCPATTWPMIVIRSGMERSGARHPPRRRRESCLPSHHRRSRSRLDNLSDEAMRFLLRCVARRADTEAFGRRLRELVRGLLHNVGK